MSLTNIIAIYILFLNSFLFAQTNDQILGKWTVEDSGNIVEVIKTNNKYWAKIIEVANGENDNIKKDLIVLKNFEYNKDENNYIKGTVYAPKLHKEFRGTLKITDKNVLSVKANMAFFSKEVKWFRIYSK
ncbi:MAG TPA: DUF2147 domain-containing protein [Melioribacteraceae bacterium]|nr:DUF2147 domain-containing protein [Melioribacteraceae bacterium]